ncbi:MAG: carboxylate-amine ligase [Cyanobacteriota bacterium]|nr:carboxylate-amine ligase [Cyanobacteriota bacterium]
MGTNDEDFTLGIEEEYQIIDPETRQLCGRAGKILSLAREKLEEDTVQREMHRSQIEIATPVCRDLREVRSELERARGAIVEAAHRDGKAIAAAGTHPFSSWKQQQVTSKERYEQLEQDYQQIVRDLIIFGCHVHVGVSDRALAIEVMNRARIWLSVLLALAGNSPFWVGEETGYDSYRTELWSRWPLSGPPAVFANEEEYQGLIDDLIATGVIEDATKIYWDIRLSERFPTVEFRATDVCMTVDEAVAIAGLARGLVKTCYESAIAGIPFKPVRSELLRVSHWWAARYGLDSKLIDVLESRPVPARALVQKFLDYIRPALEELGEWEEVSQQVNLILEEGNGAKRQRRVYQRAGSYEDVVDFIVEQTQSFSSR